MSGSPDPRLIELRDLLCQLVPDQRREAAPSPGADPSQGDLLDEALALAEALAHASVANQTSSQTHSEYEPRLQELLDMIVALVSFDYERRATISDNNDVFDGMAAGLNMLGEELSGSTVSRAYMTNILESMDDAVFVVVPTGEITTVNRAAAELVGEPGAQLLGRQLDAVLPGVAVNSLDSLDSLIEAGGIREMALELPSQAGSAEPLMVSLSASVMYDRGKVQGLVYVARDVSESRRLEAERWELREAVQRQAVLVEELSTPLIPITDRILVMPLVGPVDEERAVRMLEVLLEGIASRQAKVAILDITGVHAIGIEGVQGIARATRAASLIGAQILLTGLRPDLVYSLMQLDTNLDTFVTFNSLHSGIVHAMELVARGHRRRVSLVTD